ncbi:ARABIDOPSIS THALIANA PROTEIN ARGININE METHYLTRANSFERASE 6, protein arginine methyltransferase 6 [Hibiscus trionum]|uniref:ARABIDOPSIS THALIANA PROTEIN ARGININE METHYLTRANSFERASE 6, protein arginine methyltransferase 6 n=1 Tax=Hibiscus trionum TaxID=183268 RepID=A0A9W7J2N9_HIBTR|nr:ARABIDOPSIS THALIANA PROTEIN ARGININE METHYLTRANSFERASE 6, protein arginine methyltransferase 6 [Hibiscus trionum]
MYGITGYSNGYHQNQQQHISEESRGGGRRRRGGRRSRHRHGFGISDHQQHYNSDEKQEQKSPPPCTDFDMAYFHSYAHVGIHEEMIKDRVRTDTYRAAIMEHQSFIEGKVVMDVGCGTGILSIFCAQAGAKRVYAVDASDIALQAKEVVKANNLAEKVIILHGRVEDVEIDEEVDVIISEWMGYMLLYESMLGSVITARDRWLKPGGLILPSNATLYMAPITHPDRYSDSIEFWRNVYGIDMSAMLQLAKQCAFEEPCVETITGENVLTWPHVVKHVDCYTIQHDELESVSTRYKFQSMMRAPLHGFAFWFDVEFSVPANSPTNNHIPSVLIGTSNNNHMDGIQKKKRANPNEALVLSTAPEDPPTHWQQTLIYFYDPIDVEQDQIIEGSLTLSQSKENRRFMNIHLEYSSGGRSYVKESVMR